MPFHLKIEEFGRPRWFAGEAQTDDAFGSLILLCDVFFDAYAFDTEADAEECRDTLELGEAWDITESGEMEVSPELAKLMQQ